MNQGPIRASVVLPSRNRRPLLERQVACLLAQETPGFDYEVIVVDDASTDDTAEYLERAARASSRLRFLRRTVLGSNEARNDGVAIARGDVVLFTDDDCVAPPGWVRAGVEGLDARPEAAGIYGPVTCSSKGITPLTRQIVALRPHHFYYTCNVAYRKSVLEAVEGLDPEILFSFGDVELAARVLERGAIDWVPAFTTSHPPRPRTWRTADEWRETLSGEWRLRLRSPAFYRRTRAPCFLAGVLLHWVFGSTLKDLVRHRAFAIRDFRLYADFLHSVVAEKLRLLRVLPDFLAKHRCRRRCGRRKPKPAQSPLHVCVFGTWRRDYSRNRIVHEGLRRNGVRVTECHAPLWRGIEDRVAAVEGGFRRLGFLGRVVVAYAKALGSWLCAGDHDILMVGYPGQFDVFLARILATLRGRPLVMDVFMSIWLVAKERGLGGVTDALRVVERTALSLPDRLLHDTAPYVDWLHRTHRTDPRRFRLVPTGADDRLFAPTGAVPEKDGRFRVLFHGTFIPNHGVETIVHAAHLLRDETDVRFEFVGDGPTRPAAEEIAREHALKNVRFTGWMDSADLAVKMETSHVCLGSFGTTPQSLMTVQNKIFEGLAMARPVISGDGPAVREALVSGRDLLLVGRRDPAELAAAILRLRDEPGLVERLAREGHARFLESYTVEAIGRTTRGWLEELLPARRRSTLTR